MKTIITIVLICSPMLARAQRVTQAEIQNVGQPANVSISTEAWTRVDVTPLSGRSGVYLNNFDSNTANFYVHLASYTATPVVSTTTAAIELLPNGEFIKLPISELVYIWAVSKHTAAENIGIQQFKLER